MSEWGGLGIIAFAVMAMTLEAQPAVAHKLALAEGRRWVAASERDEDGEHPSRLGDGIWDLASADMDGDARADLVVATGGPGAAGAVSLLIHPGDGDAEHWPSTNLEPAADYGRVAVGDIDGDGVNDVAALTFSTHLLRWWLLRADQTVKEQRSISFAAAPAAPVDADGIGRACPGPHLPGQPVPTLASLAFADLDVDGALELVVASYSSGDAGGVFLFSFDRRSGCFSLRQGGVRRTHGSLRVRFFDVDADGALDIVTSRFALGGPGGAPPTCADCLEWGSWWPAAGGEERPLRAQLDDTSLSAAVPTPELNVVDFDAVQTPSGPRFALAASAHLCPAGDCWSVGQGGFVSVVDASGNELYSGQRWKALQEEQPPIKDARLLPRAVSFQGSTLDPALVGAYWWATRRKDTACSRLMACPGPLAFGALDAQPRVLGKAFAQALGWLDAPSASRESRRVCYPEPRPLLWLPELPVASITELTLDGVELPEAAHSWVPGSGAVALAPYYARARGRLCVEYRASSHLQLAVADSNLGARLIAL